VARDDLAARGDEVLGAVLRDDEQDVERVQRPDRLDGDVVGVPGADADQEQSQRSRSLE
jgi:hypothetical protein